MHSAGQSFQLAKHNANTPAIKMHLHNGKETVESLQVESSGDGKLIRGLQTTAKTKFRHVSLLPPFGCDLKGQYCQPNKIG